ncbi:MULTISPECIES: TauD/TfdA family dioxygenase [Streptomyces]|uniref:TauD/TfdA family dioxygenase n=1 Tax=Streptomyces doudnae TaxID=3075536 RepID=A0ABD5F0H7_9ACTN|nr:MULTISPECIES: TauD/TfdA family dioxygenase [unclassified Streptomyces]MDT0440119.1 TauD/TfdA family dioxygenase [Streptomyces sp. DSM 41981]MYQ69431.1 taurine dioxygenase [Streptomyces sp. SID4950]SCE53495.1 taurine dioxygenase [Streptomyces sp. SolWspMP-5a-2]
MTQSAAPRRATAPTPGDAFDVRPVSGALGAEVRGVDLNEITDAQFDRIHALMLEHLVLFFPDQEKLTPKAHVAFGRRFGEVEVHPFLPKLPDHPEITVIEPDKGGKADEWHIDVSFSPSPPIASILHLITCPPAGGDTMWSNQYRAYETLSPSFKEMLEGLTAVHVLKIPPVVEMSAEHPVVRIHPVTGHRSLYVTRMWTSHIPQLSRQESDAVLQHLFEHSEQPAFTCRYRWDPHTVALWDNRVTQHMAINDYQEHRRGQRVTVNGDLPTGGTPAKPEYRRNGDERYYPRRVNARVGY